MTRLDETNLQILHFLQANARTSITELAQRVGRSESTVRDRVSSLEMDGVLLGYEARVDWTRAGLAASAVLRARCSLDNLGVVARELQSMPNVTRSMLLTGSKPVLAMMRVRDLGHLHQLMGDNIGGGHLKDIEAEIVLDNLVAQRPPRLDYQGHPATAPVAALL